MLEVNYSITLFWVNSYERGYLKYPLSKIYCESHDYKNLSPRNLGCALNCSGLPRKAEAVITLFVSSRNAIVKLLTCVLNFTFVRYRILVYFEILYEIFHNYLFWWKIEVAYFKQTRFFLQVWETGLILYCL